MKSQIKKISYVVSYTESDDNSKTYRRLFWMSATKFDVIF